jgi:serine/threonine protein kinase
VAAAAAALLHEAAAGQLSSGLAGLGLQQDGSQHANPHAATAAAAAAAPPLQQCQQQPAADCEQVADETRESAVLAAVAAAVSEGAGDQGDSAGLVFPAGNSSQDGPEDDPSLAVVSSTEQTRRQLKATQTMRLQRQAPQAGTDGSQHTSEPNYTGEVLKLCVEQLRGSGATGEVYDVEVLAHTIPEGPLALGQAVTSSAPGPLEGQTLCLKVCKAFSQVPEKLQQCLFRNDAAVYIRAMDVSMAQHHSMMSQLGVPGSNVVCSHLYGRVRVGHDNWVPALLMDRASSGSLDSRLQQLAHPRNGIQDLSRRESHYIMQQMLCGLYQIHDHGWAFLDLKPANIVGCCSTQSQPSMTDTMWKLVDFGSAQEMRGTSHRIVLNLPGTDPYMGPEWRLEGIVSCQTDVWALGILLIELRVGHAPHSELCGLMGQDPEQELQPLASRLAAHQAALQRMKQSSKYAALTEREWGFIERCLAYNWEQRPTTTDLWGDKYISTGAA